MSSWAPLGGPTPTVGLTAQQAALLGDWPKDGTDVRTPQNGKVWRFVAGAPMRIATWDAVGGRRPVIDIDQRDIDNAGLDDPWLGVNDSPAVSEILHGAQTSVRSGSAGRVDVLVAGSPQPRRTWTAFGGVRPVTTIDQRVLDRIEVGQPDYRFLAAVPVEAGPG